MWQENIIEEYSINEPSPRESCAVIDPKSNGSSCINLDAHDANKAIIPPVNQYANDTRFQLAGTEYFSRLDFTLVFQ